MEWQLREKRRALLRVWLAQDAAGRVSGNQQFLIGGNNVGRQARILASDSAFDANCFLILFTVQRQSGPIEPFANARPSCGRILADPSSEHDGLRTAHGGEEGSDVLSHAVAE